MVEPDDTAEPPRLYRRGRPDISACARVRCPDVLDDGDRSCRSPRTAVYAALVSAEAIATWRVPDGMRAEVHEFDATVGGVFRVSLSYESAHGAGKTSARTDTYHGRFLDLVPGEQVVEEFEFESDDPAMRGRMTMTTRLADAGTGTDVTVHHDGVPEGVSAADNELGTRMALAHLDTYVQGR